MKIFSKLIKMPLSEPITAFYFHSDFSINEKIEKETTDMDIAVAERRIPLLLKCDAGFTECNCFLIGLFVIAVTERMVNVEKNARYGIREFWIQ